MPSSTGTLVFNDQKIQAPDIYATESLGVGVSDPTSNLEVVGNAYVSSNLEVGTANLFVDTTTGNVGVGTTSPGFPLDVVFSGDSGIRAKSTSSHASLNLDSGSGYGYIRFQDSGSETVWLQSKPSGDLVIRPQGGDETVLFGANGNVGIGTSPPNEKLEIYDTSSTSSGIRIHDSTSNAPKIDFLRGGTSRIGSQTEFGLSDYSDWRIQANGPSLYIYNQYTGANSGSLKNVMTMLHNSGNVGIGTASPEGALDIVTSSTKPALWLRSTTQGGWVRIRMSDTPDGSYNQYCTLEYNHQDSQSFGVGNRLHFSTNQSTSVFSLEGTLMIGVDGKDSGYMINSTGSGRKNLWIQSTYGGNTSQNYGWWIGPQNQSLNSGDNDLYFGVVRNGSMNIAAYIQDALTNREMNNFTGQHRTFVKDVPIQQLEDKEGLIVSADQNEFIRMSGGIACGNEAITTNESLPVVSFSTKSNDKKCFGVVSTTEDPENRVEVYGNFASNIRKEVGDTRVYINSVGEGAVWVTNINGSLESGDYITTSNVAGYGQRQDDDILHNYTVAKITMDCDFNPQTQPKKIIKKELANVDYWIDYATSEIKQEDYETLPENEREIHEDKYYRIYKREIRKANPENDRYAHEVHEELVNVLDEHGELQWEDHPTETEKAYKIRYLTADGQITDEANAVHIAAFVGCTYHCG